MKNIIEIPTYWSMTRGDEAYKIYDHPTPIGEGGTLGRLLESLTKIKIGDTGIWIFPAPLVKDVEKKVSSIVENYELDIHVFSSSDFKKIQENLKNFPGDFAQHFKMSGYGNIRNMGLVVGAMESADNLILLDDDEIVEDKDYIKKTTQFVGKKWKGRIIGGIAGYYVGENNTYLLDEKQPWWKWLWKKEKKMNEVFKIISSSERLNETTFAFGGNMVINKSLFREVPFDPWIAREGDASYMTQNSSSLGWKTVSEKTLLLLDTDIGDDIDDAWALAASISHPGIELVGVTTVHGDTQTRAALARLLLGKAHVEVEVVAGMRDTLDRIVPLQRPCYADVLGPEEASLSKGRTDAIVFMAEMVRKHKGLVLCAIGPLTNVARFALEFPKEFSNVSRLVLMCGHLLPSRDEPEYNAGADPRATQIVLTTEVSKFLVGLDVTTKCALTEGNIEALRAKSTPLSETLYRMTRLWEEKTSGSPVMHDPLTVLSAAEDGLVHFEPMRIEADETGRMRRLEGEPNAHAAIYCDPNRLRARLLEIIG